MNDTISYYSEHAESFVKSTVVVDFSAAADRFLAYLPVGARILDYGCGSGRDTGYFLEKGYHVEAADGCLELCRMAEKYTGIPVKQMLFEELNEIGRYDGIWACSSILHVEKALLPDIFRRMIRALKANGILYASFKYGDFDGMRNGRQFSDFTEETFDRFLLKFPELKIVEKWISADVRPERGDEKWLNIICRKTVIH